MKAKITAQYHITAKEIAEALKISGDMVACGFDSSKGKQKPEERTLSITVTREE